MDHLRIVVRHQTSGRLSRLATSLRLNNARHYPVVQSLKPISKHTTIGLTSPPLKLCESLAEACCRSPPDVRRLSMLRRSCPLSLLLPTSVSSSKRTNSKSGTCSLQRMERRQARGLSVLLGVGQRTKAWIERIVRAAFAFACGRTPKKNKCTSTDYLQKSCSFESNAGPSCVSFASKNELSFPLVHRRFVAMSVRVAEHRL